jgi:hypothetical protein
MDMFQAPTLPDISDDKDEWPSLDQNEDAFEAQFQSNDCLKAIQYTVSQEVAMVIIKK